MNFNLFKDKKINGYDALQGELSKVTQRYKLVDEESITRWLWGDDLPPDYFSSAYYGYVAFKLANKKQIDVKEGYKFKDSDHLDANDKVFHYITGSYPTMGVRYGAGIGGVIDETKTFKGIQAFLEQYVIAQIQTKGGKSRRRRRNRRVSRKNRRSRKR